MPKKILVVGSVPPPYHGSNIMCESYLDALTHIGVKYYFINKKFSSSISEIKKLKLNKITKSIKIIFDIIRIKNKFKPSAAIMFISTTGYALVFEYIICRILYLIHIPYIIRMGGFGYFEKSKLNKLQYKLTRYIFHHAELGIILNEILEEDVVALINPKKLIVIPNTLKDTKYIKKNHNNSEIKLLFCSNLLPGKGAVEFIKSIIEINKLKKYKIKANIIGDYHSLDFFNELLTLAKPVKQIVYFRGLVTGDEKLKIYAESDVFVFPSYYELETFGLVNLEAMRAGLPVISTNHAAIPNIVINNKTGFIVQPRDIKELTEKIILLIENKELRINYGMNGRERFLKYYNSNILENKLKKIINLY